jgi:hypothetical protein
MGSIKFTIFSANAKHFTYVFGRQYLTMYEAAIRYSVERYRRTSTYELSRNEQFIFTSIAQTDKLRLPIYLMNTEPRAYEHLNKLTLTNLTIYLMKK